MAIISIFSTKQDRPVAYGDVRDLPAEQQAAAWRCLLHTHEPRYLKASDAIQLLQLDPEAAARFARTYGRTTNLVFDEDQGRWIPRERPEWRRRLR